MDDDGATLDQTPTQDDIAWAGAARLAALVAGGQVSAAAVTEVFLARIARLDPGLNAFSVVLGDEARAEAATLDAELAATGPRGALHGVPVAIKDEIDVAGVVTTYGGRGNTSPAGTDSELVRRLRAAGAVVIGKTRMPEFGLWPYTESVAGGLTLNPWDRTRTPGGSSGGTAVAVATAMVPVAIGGDGGGSIRIPSACCGLYGLKPERGRVSTAPAGQLWWALGTAGPLARSVADSALVYDVIRGNVATDVFTAPEPPLSFGEAAASEPPRLRVGWCAKSALPGRKADPEDLVALAETAALLEELGHDVREVTPDYPDVTTAFVPQMLAAVRASVAGLEHPRRAERLTRQMATLGTWATRKAVDRALAAGEKAAARTEKIFDEVDVLLTPTLATRPPTVGRLDGVNALGASWRAQPMIAYTGLWNVTGNPAAAVPAGLGTEGLPRSVQLVGRRGDETTLLSLSAQVERERPWAHLHPPGT